MNDRFAMGGIGPADIGKPEAVDQFFIGINKR
jgi:hypothetical protein